MARLVTDGFELGAADPFFTVERGGIYTNASAHSGAYTMNGGGGDPPKLSFLPGLGGEYYLRIYSYGTTAPSPVYMTGLYGSTIFYISNDAGSLPNTRKFTLYGTNYAVLKAWTTEFYVQPYAWNMFEFYLGDGASVRVNGVEVPDPYVGTNLFIASNYPLYISGATNGQLDDIAINNTNGAVDNSWPGEGMTFFLGVDGDDGTPEWTPSAAGANYLMLGVPNNDDTSYIRTNVDAATDGYTLSAPPEIIAASRIIRVEPTVIALKEDVASENGVDLGVVLAGVTYESGKIALSAAYKRASSTLFQNPATNAEWTSADLASLKIKVKASN